MSTALRLGAFWCTNATTRAIRRACARNAHAGFKDTPAFLLPSLLRQGAIGSARIASCPFAPPIRQRRRWCGALRLVVWVRAPHEKPTQRAQPPLLPALAGSRGMWLFVFLSARVRDARVRECASARFSLHARRLDRQTRAHAQARAGQTAHVARLVVPCTCKGPM